MSSSDLHENVRTEIQSTLLAMVFAMDQQSFNPGNDEPYYP